MNQAISNNANRVNFVDSLRGYALLGILVMHSLEHFNYYLTVTSDNEILQLLNLYLDNFCRFIFSSKTYTIFSLLFGFSFFIQDNSQLKKGYDFRPRFLWRLVLLAGWGFINALFYTGDMLVVFSVIGLLLIATARLSDKIIKYIAIFLLLQPTEWLRIIYVFFNMDYTLGESYFWSYYVESVPVLENGNLLDTMKMAFGPSILYSFVWWFEDGRVFQIAGLFLMGMLAGRRRLFVYSTESSAFWKRALVISILVYFPLSILQHTLGGFLEHKAIIYYSQTIMVCYTSLALTVFIISLFYFAYYTTKYHRILDKLEPYGRVSLTMYITQSILGGFIFHNWGLGLASETTPIMCIGFAILIFLVQCAFANFWLKNHKQGPLEWVWKKLTWIGNDRK